MDAGLRLRLPRDPARDHGDLHVPLAAVRQVLSHLPAAGAASASASTRTSAATRSRERCRALRPSLRLAHARRGSDRRRATSSVSLSRSTRRAAADHYQWICPPCRRAMFAAGARRRLCAACAAAPLVVAGRWRRPTSTRASAKGRWARPTREQLPWLIRSRRSRAQRPASVREPQRPLDTGSERSLRTAPGLRRRERGSTPASSPIASSRRTAASAASSAASSSRSRTTRSIGFEPWEEFPVQPRHALPEGREALPAGRAPRPAAARARARPIGARRLPPDRLRGGHRARRGRDRAHSSARTARDAFGVLSGASLTTEKTYLMGKFARVCLKTPYIDYNGRLCMVSAGAGNKKAFGIDRAANPWSDILGAEVDLDQRRERRRVRADHHQLRLAGARARREDHRRRSAHHADRPHLRPVPAGQARAATSRCSTASCT